MAIPITVPRLGWNMEEGTFAGWLMSEGAVVRPGDRVFALESEKATEEIESLDGGTLRIPAHGPKPGDVVAVGTIIGFLEHAEPVTIGSNPLAPPGRAANPAESSRTPTADPDPVASPVIRGAAREPGIDLQTVRGSGPGRTPATPRARRASRELGIDPAGVRGTGRNGRVRERDVRAAAPAGALVPVVGTRRTIATRMVESQRVTAPVTLTTTADATNLVHLRNQYKAADAGPVPSYTDLIVKLSAGVLRAHPHLTGQWTEAGIRLATAIHIGVAVDTAAGLVVPVVRDVEARSLRDLAATTRDLIERARSGRLSGSDMQCGCFTVTNLGAFGIDAFTPIINHPECAVLGVGRIARRPAVVGDVVVPRDQVTLSLTFDHRIVDGAPAARFLQALVRAIENPDPGVDGNGGAP
ncbi:MAG TPA: dihydrolipoamide acetyltransferase family protein [Gemmataceae bacterium]|nr:dihydrolipoamide acetyltransferase family protein [Gemmataceae bacterium]